MASFINRLCQNKECDSHAKGTEDQPYKALCQIVGATNSEYKLKCGACGEEFPHF